MLGKKGDVTAVESSALAVGNSNSGKYFNPFTKAGGVSPSLV